LDALCDLQICTGTAIVIAGFTQLGTMSRYHMVFILDYWSLTLNSFWAARAGYMLEDDMPYPARGWIRRFMLFISRALSIVFQVVLIRKEWDAQVSGQCYISHDRSTTKSDIFWV
ncbi:hypothetical protein BJ875DRAFT_356265, partial [Amylocarpus encephaloides]